MDVDAKVRDILLDLLDVSEDEITPEARLLGDLKASSVDLVEILAALENEFDISISDAEAQELRTVDTIVGFVNKKTA